MPTSQPPLGAYNFSVTIHAAVPPATGGEIHAGFSDVSGINNEVNFSDYRQGDYATSGITKVANTSKAGEVSFKRGMGLGLELAQWFQRVREGAHDPRTISVTMLDGGRRGKIKIVLYGCQPKTFVGPTLAGKGGGEVALEEVKVVCERVDYESVDA